MTEEEKARKVSAIKRINQRLTDIGKQLGKDTQYYQRFKNAILLSIPEEARTGSDTISRSEKTLDKIPNTVLADLLKFHTVGEIRKTAREQLAQDKGVKPSKISKTEVSDYIDLMDEVNKGLSKISKDDSKFYDIYWHNAGPGAKRPSYRTLKDMLDAREEAAEFRAAGNEEGAQYVENKLVKRIEAESEENWRRTFE